MISALALASLLAADSPIDLVEPLIGTARKDQTIGAVNSGQTYPAVGLPFAMTHFTPQTQATENKCISPYYFQDARLQGFRGTHWWSGSCTQDYGSVTLAAITGPLVTDPEKRASRFDRAREKRSPDYYAVTLDDYGIRAELTGAARAGVLRLTFPRAEEAYLLVHPNARPDEGQIELLPERREIVGSNPVRRLYAGKGQPAGFAGHFVARFDVPIERFGTWSGDRPSPGARSATGKPGAFVRLSTRAGQVVEVRVGTSFVSVDEARRNLDQEIGAASFREVRAHARAAWNEALGRVTVQGGSRADRTIFYTALYHALLMPRLFSDHSGSYPGFAGTPVKRAQGWAYYDDFSLWDTFRAVHPLLVLVQPERVPDMVRSMIAKAEQGGWMPNFPGWNSYTTAMVGDHGAALIADAHAKGVGGFDLAAAYAALRRNAFESPPPADYVDGKGRRALGAYQRLGYIPLEEEVAEAFHKREQVSRTLEYGYDDFALAQLARAVGRGDDEATLLARARRAWRSVFDPQVGFVRGRHADGRWADPFDPSKEQPWITEGTPWQYTFFVPHDLPALVMAVGGREAFARKLDEFFGQGHYWHGNEPGHHIPYLYVHAGAPWRTQEEVRRILRSEYGLGPGGLKGNDDTGQLSAWFVFSALGFYPVCPGAARYELGAPLFPVARLRVGSRTFTVRATGVSDRNLYIQQARLDGKPLTRAWLTHEEIARGGTLVLQMGPRPNKAWASRDADLPPPLLAPEPAPSGR